MGMGKIEKALKKTAKRAHIQDAILLYFHTVGILALHALSPNPSVYKLLRYADPDFSEKRSVTHRMKEAAKLPSYNADKLREGAQVLVDEGVLTAEDLDELVGIAMSDPAGIGRTFGKKLGKHMGRLRGMLEASRE